MLQKKSSGAVAVNRAITNRGDILLIGIHVLLGLISTAVPQLIGVIVGLIVVIYIFRYSWNDRSKFYALLFISYLTGFEMLNRVTGTSFLPYESIKYLQILMVFINLIVARPRLYSMTGILILVLLLPSAIIFPTIFKSFIFSSLGIISLGFLLIFTGFQKINLTRFISIAKAFLFPCISFVTYITIKSPEISQIDFSTGANLETAGGFGTNQVSTFLGAALCLLFILMDNRKYLANYYISLGLLIYFFLRALLTFSRGGIAGAVISIVLALLFFRKIKQETIVKLAATFILFLAIFIVVNKFTGGELLLRYQGETAGTISGTKEKNINSFSSGRIDYAKADLSIWYDNPILGVGPGNSSSLRTKYGLPEQGAPHTEATRLLAEHGIFGLMINILLVLWPVYVVYKTPGRNLKFIKAILFIFAYVTTYHAAIRTGITPLFYALASADIRHLVFIRKMKNIAQRGKKIQNSFSGRDLQS